MSFYHVTRCRAWQWISSQGLRPRSEAAAGVPEWGERYSVCERSVYLYDDLRAASEYADSLRREARDDPFAVFEILEIDPELLDLDKLTMDHEDISDAIGLYWDETCEDWSPAVHAELTQLRIRITDAARSEGKVATDAYVIAHVTAHWTELSLTARRELRDWALENGAPGGGETRLMYQGAIGPEAIRIAQPAEARA
jgi:hypothetical protein